MNLKALMDEKGVGLIWLSRKVNVSQRRLKSWMYGEREPPIAYLIKLADALNVTVDRLIRPQKDGDGNARAS